MLFICGSLDNASEKLIRQHIWLTDYYNTTSRNIVPTAAESSIKRTSGEKGETSEGDGNKRGTDKNLQKKAADSDPKISVKDENQEKPSSSDTRPKQGVPSTFSLLSLDQKLIV